MQSHTKKGKKKLSLKVTLKFVTLNLYQPLMITGNDSDPIKDNNNVDKIVSLSMSEIISGHFASISILQQRLCVLKLAPNLRSSAFVLR